jgi:hypothetical protein
MTSTNLRGKGRQWIEMQMVPKPFQYNGYKKNMQKPENHCIPNTVFMSIARLR